MPKRGVTARTKNLHAASKASKNLVVGVLLFAFVLVGFGSLIVFKTAGGFGKNHGAQAVAPTKPGSADQTKSKPTTEQWNPAQGLPTNITQVAFSGTSPQGYATAFINKSTQAIYATHDAGTTWQHISDIQYPVIDALAISPADPQDVVVMSASVPMAGTYEINRSLDGGHTWQTQATTIASAATVSQVGWSSATLLVSFSLDRQPIGDSSVIAFPAKQSSFHLDVDGKINGAPVGDVQVLSGQGSTVNIWGVDPEKGNAFGWTTSNTGKDWSALSYTTYGIALFPLAATTDGSTILTATADRTQLAISKDAGRSWKFHPSLNKDKIHSSEKPVLAPNGEAFIHLDSDNGAGMYGVQNGHWVKVTDKDIVALSSNSGGQAIKYWAYDTQGQLVWCASN